MCWVSGRERKGATLTEAHAAAATRCPAATTRSGGDARRPFDGSVAAARARRHGFAGVGPVPIRLARLQPVHVGAVRCAGTSSTRCYHIARRRRPLFVQATRACGGRDCPQAPACRTPRLGALAAWSKSTLPRCQRLALASRAARPHRASKHSRSNGWQAPTIHASCPTVRNGVDQRCL